MSLYIQATWAFTSQQIVMLSLNLEVAFSEKETYFMDKEIDAEASRLPNHEASLQPSLKTV